MSCINQLYPTATADKPKERLYLILQTHTIHSTQQHHRITQSDYSHIYYYKYNIVNDRLTHPAAQSRGWPQGPVQAAVVRPSVLPYRPVLGVGDGSGSVVDYFPTRLVG